MLQLQFLSSASYHLLSTLDIFTGLLQFIDLNGTLFLTFHLLKINVKECCVTLIQ